MANDRIKSDPIPIPNKKLKKAHRIGNYIYWSPPLAKGSFSKVFLAKYCPVKEEDKFSYTYPDNLTDENLLAIKKISVREASQLSIKRLQREITLLKSLSHPNIVKFYDAFTDISNNTYIVTTYCNKGNLETYTKNEWLLPEEIKLYISQLRNGLLYLVSNNILHRDIKPANLLLHEEKGNTILKIADFGLAKNFQNLSEDLSSTLCGTPCYLGPELLIDKHKYTLVSDLWPIGIIIYQLWTHQLPFGNRPKNILELIKHFNNFVLIWPKKGPDDENLEIPGEVKELLSGLLVIDPTKRCHWGNFFDCNWLKDCPKEEIEEDNSVIEPSFIQSNLKNIKEKLLEHEEPEVESSAKWTGKFNIHEEYLYRPEKSSCPASIKTDSPSSDTGGFLSRIGSFNASSITLTNSPILRYVSTGVGLVSSGIKDGITMLSSLSLNDETVKKE
jgi:serine/threonine protein kinase